MRLERNYGVIENTFNATDRNSSAKGAKAPARIGLQWLPRITRTSLLLGEKCICREKGAQPFSVAAAFVQSATRFLPSFLLNRPRSRAEEGSKFTAR